MVLDREVCIVRIQLYQMMIKSNKNFLFMFYHIIPESLFYKRRRRTRKEKKKRPAPSHITFPITYKLPWVF